MGYISDNRAMQSQHREQCVNWAKSSIHVEHYKDPSALILNHLDGRKGSFRVFSFNPIQTRCPPGWVRKAMVRLSLLVEIYLASTSMYFHA